MMTKKPTFEERLQACIITMLREEYPYTHTSDINKVATDAAKYAANDTVQRKNARKEGVRPLQLMELPAEIRSLIFEYAVSYEAWPDNRITTIHLQGMHFKDSRYGFPAVQPPITRVSRQVREETLALFYGLNHFHIELYPHKTAQGHMVAANGKSWLDAIGEKNVKTIKEVTIQYWPAILKARNVSVEREMTDTNLRFVAGVAEMHEDDAKAGECYESWSKRSH
ncbi:hypothetical protein LTR56_002346 [Elasticomyces elasticus]|nr:hypothetical protein LTR56_002346 [Elasticomyces elasticus]KAK3665910.1 hypothetical protein LTR22_003229 [Elasticomyces elasticus]KAK4929382.1 hypothetical protein LTR49_003986 [Elasticomyces elasticus]KAK5764671.1 hypothetical protein LTS12_005172 [Elasticomyces elasticus]